MADIKAFNADIKAVKDNGEFEAILSMPTVDRDGEVIDAGAFDPLPKHIPIDIDHGMSVTTTVGSGEPFYEGAVLMFRGSFASTELGQEVRTLVTEGHIRKMSVAYMGSHYEDGEDGRPHLVKAELLNAAIVAIPSNREADILAAKALDVENGSAAADGELADLAVKAGARHSSKDAALIQQAHDALAALGAKCAETEDAPASDDKSPTTDPDEAAASKAAAPRPADVDVARARAAMAEAELLLIP